MVAAQDRETLRRLAGRVREIAEQPEMEVRRRRWFRHNALQPERPLVLWFPEGAWRELLPDGELACADKLLRGWERRLRTRLYWWDHLRDDAAFEPWFDVPYHLQHGDYGVAIPQRRTEALGSYVWDPPLKDLARDLPKLRYRQPACDRAASQAELELAQDLFGDLLPARLRGPTTFGCGLTHTAILLAGMEQFMIAMVEAPETLHRLMAWLRDEQRHYMQWFEREGLLSPGHRAEYVGSGGLAYTEELPQKDWPAGQPVRLKDEWGMAESQETVGVSPKMFGEFIFPYQLPLLREFGLTCYGCCEPVHERMDYLAQIASLRRISVAPWCDQEVMAGKLGRRIIFSRKPNPTLVCAMFDAPQIREDLRATLRIAGQGVLEIILKDTHTVQNQPWRLSRWVQIALEEVDRYGK